MEYQNNHKNPYDYYDKNMCIRSLIAKTKENTKYGSILNMGVSITNHVKHNSNRHGNYHTNQETTNML